MLNVSGFISMYPGYGGSQENIRILEQLEHQIDLNPAEFYIEDFYKKNNIVASSYVREFCNRFLEYYTSSDEFLEPMENYQFGNGIQRSPTSGRWRWWKLTIDPYYIVPDFEVAKMGPVKEITSYDAFTALRANGTITEVLQKYPFLSEDYKDFIESENTHICGLSTNLVTTIWACPTCNMPNQSSLAALQSGKLACHNCNQTVMLT